MQAVVRVAFVEFPLVVGQRPPHVEVLNTLLVAQRFEPLVRRNDQMRMFVVTPIFRKVLAVHRKNALHVDLRPLRLRLETVDQPRNVAHDLLGRNPRRQIVRPDHQEELLRMRRNDRIEPVEQPGCAVAADPAVLHVAVLEQLRPLASVGDRVAQKHDVARMQRQNVEKAPPLVVVFALGEGRTGNPQRGNKNQNAFHAHRFLSSRR